MKGKISSKGRITVPKRVRTRYDLKPGSEIKFELRDDGALIRKKKGERRPIWEAIGSLKVRWRWPKGIPHTADAYMDYLRGGSYEDLTGPRKRLRRKP